MEAFLKSIPQWGYQIFIGLIPLIFGIIGTLKKNSESKGFHLIEDAPIFGDDPKNLLNPVSWLISLGLKKIFDRWGYVILIILGLMIVGYGVKKMALS